MLALRGSRPEAIEAAIHDMEPEFKLPAPNTVANDGPRYAASGIELISGPHVLYSSPPSIGLGMDALMFTRPSLLFSSRVSLLRIQPWLGCAV
jgi:hypothetical protein